MTSIVYNFVKLGCSNTVKRKQSELTFGPTWHAVGGMHTINGNPNVAKPQQYSIELYNEIGKLTGQNIGLHMTPGIMQLVTEERVDWLKSVLAKGKLMAKGYVPEYTGNDDNRWSTALLTRILTANSQKFPLFDTNAIRTRS